MSLALGIGLGLDYGGNLFSPAQLFGLSEPGVWFDPSDTSTMFTDTAGTTPVTAAGQSVALVLDKSRGLVLGSELVTNGDFSSASGWTLDATATISGGTLNINNSSSIVVATQTFAIVAGRTYEFRATCTSFTSGSVAIGTKTGAIVTAFSINGTGTYRALVVAGAANDGIRLTSQGAGFVGTIDNISVRELPGNHATQSVLAARPLYGVVPATGRRNLLTYSEQFDNAAWVKQQANVSANAGVAPDGTTTADRITSTGGAGIRITGQTFSLSAVNHTISVWVKAAAAGNRKFRLVANQALGSAVGTASAVFDATDEWQRFSFTATGGSGYWGITQATSPDFDHDLLVWGAQLETGSTATAYQRVVTAQDVTEAGVPSLGYLFFDGSDDHLVTPTITPNTDKAQVFAGVRKLSDAAFGSIVESSTDPNTINGTFAVGTGTTVGDASRRTWATALRGTVINIGGAAIYASPDTRVLSAISDIGQSAAAQEAILRLNGVQQSLSFSVADAGTGNFTAQPLYIGRRGGTSLPFNGNIYGLIVRFGANLDAGTISSTERWVAAKTGVTI